MSSDKSEKPLLNWKDLKQQWNNINWKKVEKAVNNLQSRITKATIQGNWKLVNDIQYLLVNSYHAKLLAVRKVTTNKGKRTAGIDSQIWNTPESKMKGVLSLSNKKYKTKPLKRTFINKKNGKKRPLGIPTIYDRAMQALYALALDPVAEAIADDNSYGFRKSRSTHDSMQKIFSVMSRKDSAQWVLEGDIKGCFDNINHKWLEENIPMDKNILNKFLKAGFIYNKKLFATEAGTPQGGIISPILANMVLDGLEMHIKRKYWVNRKGTISRNYNKNKIHFIRYADDFIVTAKTKEILEEIKSHGKGTDK